jgi:hypothetical protein
MGAIPPPPDAGGWEAVLAVGADDTAELDGELGELQPTKTRAPNNAEIDFISRG